MAKQIELKGLVTEVYAGDPNAPHLGGRVSVAGPGFSLEMNLPVVKVRGIRLGAAMAVSIEPD